VRLDGVPRAQRVQPDEPVLVVEDALLEEDGLGEARIGEDRLERLAQRRGGGRRRAHGEGEGARAADGALELAG